MRPIAPRSRRDLLLLVVLLAGAAGAGGACLLAVSAAHADSAATGRVVSSGPAPAAAESLLDLGLENVAVAPGDSAPGAAYENRRWRHSAEALGRVQRALGPEVTGFEERLGLTAAALRRETERGRDVVQLDLPPGAPSVAFGELRVLDSPEVTRFRVLYPCDPGFPRAPATPVARPTWRSMDLVMGVLFDYELGRIFDPVLYRLQLQPMVRYNPWPGALARAALVIPTHDDFTPSTFHPDVKQVRPGPLALEQFLWLPYAGLLSVDGGYFGENRYGGSMGLARPLAGGRILLDAQADLTGFMAFGPGGSQYSSPTHWTGFGALAWHPGLDVTVRAKAARFLYGDDGAELEVRRAMGDVDIAVFGLRSAGENLVGIRLVLPVPPMVRGTGQMVRMQPIERFAIDYRSQASLVGLDVTGVASRQDYLRQLDEPSLDANLGRFTRAMGHGSSGPTPSPTRDHPMPDLINFSGMTGFVNTPWAGVLTDRRVEVGYSRIPKKWAYDHRGQNDNEVFYGTLGFLPRVEVSARVTQIPGYRSFQEVVPGSRLTDKDYMASGRLCLLEPTFVRPGLALGAEDVKGTRRFHSTYAVAGLPYRIRQVQGRLSMGYAFKVVKASRRTLLGTFGAVEVAPWRMLVAQLEYDTEKWNLGVAVPAPYGIRFRVALLNMQSVSFGVGLGHTL